ncbi:MAG: tyrosine-type recombinase/integrase [Scytonema sp. PMC 1069.18]|nr:tyrosine-type recombinase/integrase [Scytonema sp. PMC 1069.18]MEC4888093.1 tyrosine-type recombinase/integrase [Scytonema sp. PMC 1070.18]
MTYYKPRSKPHLRLVYDSEKPKVETPKSEPKLRRPKNEDVRPREYLRPDEVEKLIAAAKSTGRNRLRDELLLLLMYRHGLRLNEAITLRWSDIDFDQAFMHVRRLKRGNDSNQPIYPDELKLLRNHKRLAEHNLPWIFISERGSTMSEDAVQSIVQRAGKLAGFEFQIHPHMLRHSCGFYLASKGFDTRLIQDYLGHRNINHTVRYTQLAPGRFNGLWD